MFLSGKTMGNSRTKNSILNMMSSIGYQMVSLVMSFVSRTIFLQILGVGYLGINGLFNDVLSMLNMAELGFGTAMTFSMYKSLAEKDYDTIAGLTNFYKKVYRIIAATILGLGLLALPFLPYLINLNQDIPFVEVYYIIFLLCNVSSYLVTYKTTVLYADQKNYLMLQHGAVWHVAEVCTMLCVLYISKNYMLYLITQLFFVYGRNFYMSHLASKHYPFLNKKIKLPKEKRKGIFKDVGSAFLYKISNVLLNATDNTLISFLISTEMVGLFSNYQIIIAKLSNLVGTMFTSLIASLGNLIVKESEGKRYNIFRSMQSLSMIISTFCVTCLLLLEEDFIRIWLGEKYVLSSFALLAIVFNFYFNVSTKPVVTFREAAGLFRKTKFIMLWTAGLNIVFSILLGKVIGLAGIMLATSISKLLTCFWYEPKLLYNEYFKKPCRLYFVEMALGTLVIGVSVVLSWIATKWFIPSNWGELVIKGIMVSLVSIVTIVVFYRKTEGFKMLYSKGITIVQKVIKK